MRKVLHVFKCIVLLVYLLALVLCCHSCIMTLFNNSLRTPTGSEPAAPVPVSVPVPVAQPKDENSVALSSGVYQKDIDSLTAVVNTSDFALLDSFPALRTADFSGSNCYELHENYHDVNGEFVTPITYNPETDALYMYGEVYAYRDSSFILSK